MDDFGQLLVRELGYDEAGERDEPHDPQTVAARPAPAPPMVIVTGLDLPRAEPRVPLALFGMIMLLVFLVSGLTVLFMSPRRDAQALPAIIVDAPAPEAPAKVVQLPAAENEEEEEKDPIGGEEKAIAHKNRTPRPAPPPAKALDREPKHDPSARETDPRAIELGRLMRALKAAPDDGEQIAKVKSAIIAWANQLTDRDARATIIRRATAGALLSDVNALQACVDDLARMK